MRMRLVSTPLRFATYHGALIVSRFRLLQALDSCAQEYDNKGNPKQRRNGKDCSYQFYFVPSDELLRWGPSVNRLHGMSRPESHMFGSQPLEHQDNQGPHEKEDNVKRSEEDKSRRVLEFITRFGRGQQGELISVSHPWGCPQNMGCQVLQMRRIQREYRCLANSKCASEKRIQSLRTMMMMMTMTTYRCVELKLNC